MNTVGDVSYRAIYNREHELALKANANLTNSRRDTAAPSDPFLYNFSVPYSHKGTAFKRGHVFGVKPGYEMLYMDPTNTGTKVKTMGSMLVDVDNTFVMKPNWFSVYTLQYRQDTFELAASTGNDDFDASKYTLKTSQILYLDEARKEAVIGNLGVTMNDAKGMNKYYNRYDLGVTFTRPMKWGYAWNAGLAAYQVTYSKATLDRTDFNLAFSTGVAKPIREWFTWSVSGTYTKNDSTNETTYEYDKFVILTQAVFTTNL